MLQSLGPALRRASGRIGFEVVGLIHSEFGFAVMFGEGHRRQYFAAGHVFKDAGPDNSLCRDDFPIDTVRVMLPAAGGAHAQAITATYAEVHLADRQREVVGAEPVHHVLGFAPRLEDERSRCVEDSRDNQLARCRFRYDGVVSSLGHVYTPSNMFQFLHLMNALMRFSARYDNDATNVTSSIIRR